MPDFCVNLPHKFFSLSLLNKDPALVCTPSPLLFEFLFSFSEQRVTCSYDLFCERLMQRLHGGGRERESERASGMGATRSMGPGMLLPAQGV
jgi:hypothetical protein